MTARIIPFPRRPLVPKPSKHVDPVLDPWIDATLLNWANELLSVMDYKPQPRNVEQIKAGVYQPGRE